MKIYTVLVLDADQRSALAVTRSLGSKEDIVVITADSHERALAGASRFSSEYIKSPSVAEEPDNYLSWLAEAIANHRVDLVIPVTEITSQFLLMKPDHLTGAKLPFPCYDRVLQLADKGRLVRAAAGLDVPAPETIHINEISDLNWGEVSFPCVIKPCLSHVFDNGNWISTKVEMISSKEQFMKHFDEHTYLKYYPFLVQEFITGRGAGVFLLYNRGEIVASFAHNRIREKPPWGGVSVLSESAPEDRQLLEMSKRLLDSAKWHGVAMVEFRITEDGLPYLMEVNTRFWGSLQLAVDSGVDFPGLLWKASVNRELEKFPSYKKGQQLRWFLGDLDRLYIMLKSKDYSKRQKLCMALQFLAPRFKNRKHEIDRWSDIGPAGLELKRYIASACKPGCSKKK